jgi:hypothetical protein
MFEGMKTAGGKGLAGLVAQAEGVARIPDAVALA